MLPDRLVELGDLFLVTVERFREVLVTLDLVELGEPLALLRGGFFLRLGIGRGLLVGFGFFLRIAILGFFRLGLAAVEGAAARFQRALEVLLAPRRFRRSGVALLRRLG